MPYYTLDIRVEDAKRSLLQTTIPEPTHTLIHLNALSESSVLMTEFLSSLETISTEQPYVVTLPSDTYGKLRIQLTKMIEGFPPNDYDVVELLEALANLRDRKYVSTLYWLIMELTAGKLFTLCDTPPKLQFALQFTQAAMDLAQALDLIPVTIAAPKLEPGLYVKVPFGQRVKFGTPITDEWFAKHVDVLKLLEGGVRNNGEFTLKFLSALVPETMKCGNSILCAFLTRFTVSNGDAIKELSAYLAGKYESMSLNDAPEISALHRFIDERHY